MQGHAARFFLAQIHSLDSVVPAVCQLFFVSQNLEFSDKDLELSFFLFCFWISTNLDLAHLSLSNHRDHTSQPLLDIPLTFFHLNGFRLYAGPLQRPFLTSEKVMLGFDRPHQLRWPFFFQNTIATRSRSAPDSHFAWWNSSTESLVNPRWAGGGGRSHKTSHGSLVFSFFFSIPFCLRGC